MVFTKAKHRCNACKNACIRHFYRMYIEDSPKVLYGICEDCFPKYRKKGKGEIKEVYGYEE